MVAKLGKKEDASNNSSSISNHSDDCSNQFSMLNHGTNRVSLEDAVGGKAHVAQLHAISGYAYTIKSCSLKDLSSDSSLPIQTNDLIYNITTNGRSEAVGQEKITSSSCSTENTQGRRDGLKANETGEYSKKHAASEDASVNVKHISHSLAGYSASSGDGPYPDAPCASMSDINLQTKPSRVASPSKTPPKIVRKQENTKMKIHGSSGGDQEGNLFKPRRNHQIRYKIGAPKRRGLQSSDVPDVEVDADSTAAASVAAMKEAMEQAQARLKSARELMERQRDNSERWKKLDHSYGTRNDEEEDAKAFEEEKNLREGMVNKTLLKEGKQMKDYAIDDLQKATEVGKTPPDHEESLTDAAGSLHMRQGNGFKSSQMRSKSKELCEEWKIEENFYELVNNERFSAVKDGKQEDAEKKLKTSASVNEVKERYSEEVELAYEFNRTVRLHQVNTPVERVEIGDNSDACNMTSKEETRKTPEKAQDTCTLKDSLSSDFLDINQKLQAAREALVSGEELKKPITGKKASFGQTEKNVQSSNNTFKFEEAYHDDEHKKLHAAKEPCKYDENDKESKETNATSVSYESEEKLEMFRRTGVLYVHENEMEVTSATCRGEADGELVAPGETCQYENDEYKSGNNRHGFYYEENECKLETTSFVSEHGGSQNLYRAQGKFISGENDLRRKVAQNGSEVRENSEELKPLREPNNKKQNADCGTSAAEDNVKTYVLRSDNTERENGKFKDSTGVVGSEVTHSQFDAAQGRAENKHIGGVQQGSRAENEDQRDASQEVCPESSSSHDAVGTPGTVVTENSNPVVDNKEDEGDISVEREYEKEKTRKAKEEKEKERESEKDRFAVERAREAHKRALSEARKATERIAVERATAEARQRAFKEAQGKAQKASAEALEKSLLGKALKEAKLRAERAAVERLTAEARERAVEKAIAEKASADARRRAEQLKNVSLDESRKDNEAGSGMGDSRIKLKASSSNDFQNPGYSGSSQIYADSTAHGEDESPSRCKAKSERHQRTVERAAKALAEKNLRDVLAQREQADRNRLAELLDADVRRWSAGKEGNLRALLSTLQYILGPESGWHPIPLTDVITAAAVKKSYRKATLFVHPDKLQQRGASMQQKYICEEVFDLLKEAWNKFSSEER